MKITIIGAGNMGGAIARGLLGSQTVAPYDITIAKFTPSKADTVFGALGCKTTTDPNEASTDADVIIIAVKPWIVEHVVRQIKPHAKHSIIVSVAGGISLETLSSHFSQAIFRVIPNTAASIGKSITFISAVQATKEQRELIGRLFASLGDVVEIEEEKMAACTVLGSCGIAFAMRYVHASMQGAVELGIAPVLAQKIMVQTLIGTAGLLSEQGAHPATEIDLVTTPGGTTIKGLNAMEEYGFSSSVIQGLKASAQK